MRRTHARSTKAGESPFRGAGVIRPDQQTDVTRRSALQLSGIAIAAAALAPGTGSHAAIAFGVNRNYYESFTAAVHGTRAVRIYYDPENVFPATWPNRLPGAWATLSIRPHPVD